MTLSSKSGSTAKKVAGIEYRALTVLVIATDLAVPFQLSIQDLSASAA